VLVHEYCTVRGLMDARLGAGIVALGIVAAAKTHAVPLAKGRHSKGLG
jgi:hypothetical protein